MKLYSGTFRKKNGEIREMHFVKISDLEPEFLASKIVGTGTSRELPEGMELVYDVEAGNFRTFNWETALDEVTAEEINPELLSP